MKVKVERWGVIEEEKFVHTYSTEEDALNHIRVRLGDHFKGYVVKLNGEYEREEKVFE